MCKLVIQKHRCGVDTIQQTNYCHESVMNHYTGQRFACGRTSWKEPDGISCDPCHLDRCFFCRYGWRWRCCHCGTGPNKQQICCFDDGGKVCEHKVCDYCVPARYVLADNPITSLVLSCSRRITQPERGTNVMIHIGTLDLNMRAPSF